MDDGATTGADVVIFGGGVAGLWTLNTLVRRGLHAVLFERDALGAGQTGWSQGILHSGVKYALGGVMNESAAALSTLPERWKACLRGAGEMDLTGVRVRSECCWLWRTDSLRSKVGMLGAKLALSTKPQRVHDDQRPPVLRGCPGEVARLAEWVIDPRSLVHAMAALHPGRVMRGELAGVERIDERGITMRIGNGQTAHRVQAGAVVLAAGGGNAALRRTFGLNSEAQQLRPLRMLVVKGNLPELNGHCVDGAATRVTITSLPNAEGSIVWQVGGQVAERGPSMDVEAHRAWALDELRAAIPGLSLQGCVAASYEAPRAEGATGGKRPDDAVVMRDAAVITVWPTKLVLAPRAADLVSQALRDLQPKNKSTNEPKQSVEQAPLGDYAWDRPAFAWRAVDRP